MGNLRFRSKLRSRLFTVLIVAWSLSLNFQVLGDAEEAESSGPTFQSDFVRLTVESLYRAKDGKTLTLLLELENLQEGDLTMLFVQKGLTLSDNRGESAELGEMSGATYGHWGTGSTNYSVFSPGTPMPVVMRFVFDSENEGTRFAFATSFLVKRDTTFPRYSAGISGIMLNE